MKAHMDGIPILFGSNSGVDYIRDCLVGAVENIRDHRSEITFPNDILGSSSSLSQTPDRTTINASLSLRTLVTHSPEGKYDCHLQSFYPSVKKNSYLHEPTTTKITFPSSRTNEILSLPHLAWGKVSPTVLRTRQKHLFLAVQNRWECIAVFPTV